MPWFLHSRLVTHVCVLVLVALAGSVSLPPPRVRACGCVLCRLKLKECSGTAYRLATFYYAWSFSRKWPNPTTTTGVIKGFAMTFHALFGFCSLLTSVPLCSFPLGSWKPLRVEQHAPILTGSSTRSWHPIRISSQSLMFGTWTTFGFAGIVFDSWWFGLMVSRKGFDLLESSRKGVTVAFCVYSGFYAVYRLVVMLFV